jgi:hypothetical protein
MVSVVAGSSLVVNRVGAAGALTADGEIDQRTVQAFALGSGGGGADTGLAGSSLGSWCVGYLFLLFPPTPCT